MEYDVCIVGAGPAGLAAAIRFKQLCAEHGRDHSVCVVEKGSEVGAHAISGNVLQTTALDELFPGWRDQRGPGEACEGIPLRVEAKRDRFYLLTKGGLALRLPTPPQMHNKGNYVVSLSELTRWMAGKAEGMGVEVYPGFPGKELLLDWQGAAAGVATGDFGVAKDGRRKASFAPGVDLVARVTLLAEGARGSLSEEAVRRFGLRERAGACPQTYALGIKEVWELPGDDGSDDDDDEGEGEAGSDGDSKEKRSSSSGSGSGKKKGSGGKRSKRQQEHEEGLVVHTVGAPLDHWTYGGGFIYHMDKR